MNHTLLLVSERPNVVTGLLEESSLAGYNTYTAHHANDALQIMNTKNIDAVICDAALADVDGYHLCYKIRKSDKLKGTPVIICSNGTDKTEARMARDLGADIFINGAATAQVIVDHITSIFDNPKHYTNRLSPQSISTEAMLRYNEQLIAQLEKQNEELRKTKSENERMIQILNEAQQIAHIGSFELNLETYESNWSIEQYKILGTTPEETTPSLNSFLAFIHPDDRERIKTAIEVSFANNSPHEFRCRLLRKDGSARLIYCYTGYTFNEEGKAIRTYGITHDITEKAVAEQQVTELNANLEERVNERTEALVDANQQLESFAYSVSHDLRAPLRSIYAFSQLLHKKHGYQLDENGNELLQFICNSAAKMQELIGDLLAFSRVDKNALDLTDIGMNELVTGTWKSLTATIENVPAFKINQLPFMRADKPLITQVLVNFLTNAIKYSSHNSQPMVEVGTVTDSKVPTIYIKDNGVGFSMLHYDKLFTVFQRLHTSNEFEGTGVGLAIVKRILDKHNGKVWAVSEPGQGATFYFSLPWQRLQ